MRRAGAVAAAALAVAACAGDPSPPATAAQGRPVVEVAAAAAAFEEICLDQAPDFAGSEAAMPRHGLTVLAPTGTVYDTTGTMSVRVATVTTAAGVRAVRCSVVHEDADAADAEAEVARLVAGLGAAAGAPETRRFRMASGAEKSGTVWAVTIGGRRGELSYLPLGAGLPVGSFLLEFPIDQVPRATA